MEFFKSCALLWNFLKVLAGAAAASVLWWLEYRKRVLELRKVRLESAELQRNEKQRILGAAIVAVVRDTTAHLDHPKRVVFSEDRLASACSATVADIVGALAMLQAQGRAKRNAAGSWAIW
jgi:hypothetical protein